jgi:hypothetical protein
MRFVVTSLLEGVGCCQESDPLLAVADKVAKRPDNVLGLLVRPITHNEVSIMETRGCRAENWEMIKVVEDFDPFRVRRVHLLGHCVLGRFSGDVEQPNGLRLPRGIYDTTLIDCQIGNDCLIENVRCARNLIVERGAVLFDCGSVTGSGASLFGVNQVYAVGPEVGGREVPCFACMDIPGAARIARHREDRLAQDQLLQEWQAYKDRVRNPYAWICRDATVQHTVRLADCFIGPGAVVDQAGALERVALLPKKDAAVHVDGLATVRDSVVQAGVRISGSALVQRSLLCEAATVDEHGLVSDSIIGPNTSIGKGEVSHSLVGPFVGLHHQSLLIAAMWPEGKGNVAYGAMVGANHTGRSPDQEVWPGEGMFFGLGSSIRFPCDFSEAPYLLVAAGVTLLPSQITFPFSAVTTPVDALSTEELVPRAYNELLPAWWLFANAYGIERNEHKYTTRDRAISQKVEAKIWRPDTVALVHAALQRLRAVEQVKPLYFDEDIPGIGKNFLRESSRQKAIGAYERGLCRYALRILLGEQEGQLTIPGSAEIAHALLDELMPQVNVHDRLQELVTIEQENARIVEASKKADDERGERLIPGYEAAHVLATDDPVVARARQRAASTAARVAAVQMRL